MARYSKRVDIDPMPAVTEAERELRGPPAFSVAEDPLVWKAVAEESGVVFFEWDFVSGRLVDISENVEGLLGYTRDEFIEDAGLVARVAREDFRDDFNERVFSWVQTRPHRVRMEGCFIDRKGREKWLEITGVVEYTAEGRIRGAHMLGIDITASVEARRHAEEGQEKYRLFFEGSPLAIWLLDPETLTILEANDRACDLYRIDRKRLVGTSVLDHIAPEEREAVRARITGSMVEQGIEILPRGLRVRGDGTLFPVAAFAGNVSVDGKVRRLVIQRDISEEEMLREWLLQYKETFTRAPVGLLLFKPTTLTVIEANERACQMYGVPKEAMEGAPADEVTGDGSLARVEAAVVGGSGQAPECVVQRAIHRRADGTTFPVEVATVTLNLAAGPMRLALVRDLSEDEFAHGTASALRQAVDEAQVALLFMTARGQILFGTEAAAWLLGVEDDALKGREMVSLCASGFGATLELAMADAVAGRPWRGLVRFNEPSRLAGPVRVSVAAAPTFSPREPDFLVAVISPPDGDLTARRLADAALGRKPPGEEG